ncbi:MAG: HEAT repeat domain-containing protein [Candidatus Wallbacteria bacterium]|nr:HEAT repeat domain-containing protein [Candidatus Wallbacteria bacterium]
MSSSRSGLRLGRKLAYRLLLHEACRAGDTERHAGLLGELAEALRLTPEELTPLREQEVALADGKPPRPFDPSRAMRAALRVVSRGTDLTEKEAKVLSKLAKVLGIGREQQEEMARALRAEISAGRQSHPSDTSPEHASVEGLPGLLEMASADDYGALEALLDQPPKAEPEPAPAPQAPGPQRLTAFSRPTEPMPAQHPGTVKAAPVEPGPPRPPGAPAGPAAATVQVPPAGPRKPARGARGGPAREPEPPGRTLPITRPMEFSEAPARRLDRRLVAAAALIAAVAISAVAIGLRSSSESDEPPSPARVKAPPPPPVKQPPAARGQGILERALRAFPHRPDPQDRKGAALAGTRRTAELLRQAELAPLVTGSGHVAGDAPTRISNLLRCTQLSSGDDAAARAIVRLARDRGDPMRLEAVLAASRLRLQDVGDAVETLTRSSSPMAKWTGLLAQSRLTGDRRRWEAELAAIKEPMPLGRFLGAAGDPEAVGVLVRCLRSADPATKQAALGLLAQGGNSASGALGNYTCVDAVVETVADPDPRVREAALDCLGQIADRSTLPFVLRTLTSPRAAERLAALRALGAMGDNEAAAPMLEALADPAVEVREGAAAALAGLDDLPVEFLAGRLKRLERGSEVRLLLAHVLLRARHPGILKVLWQLLPALDSTERRLAMEVLEKLAGYRARRAEVAAGLNLAASRASGELSELLADTAKRVAAIEREGADRLAELRKALGTGAPADRIGAAQLLAAALGSEAFEELSQHALAPQAAVRRRVHAVLVRLVRPTDLPFLRELYRAVEPQEQPLVAEGLARHGDPLPVEALAWQLKDAASEGTEKRAFRRLAAWGLARIGVPEAAPHLARALDDTSWQVRAAAAWGLSRSVTLGILGGQDADDIRVRLVDFLRDPRLEVQWAAGGK